MRVHLVYGEGKGRREAVYRSICPYVDWRPVGHILTLFMKNVGEIVDGLLYMKRGFWRDEREEI